MRIVAKTATYSIVHIFVAFTVAYLVSGEVHIAVGISLLEPFFQIVAFALHEQAWEKFRPGASKVNPDIACAEASLAAKLIGLFRRGKA